MIKIKPLQSFSRMPRSILEFSSYKASELYNWVLFYSIPTIKNVLPDKYLQHWLLLVISLFNLLQQDVSPQDIEQSKQLLHAFVKQIKAIYGEREMSYNIHQLLHLGLCVERWGPLWATSAFAFESHNGFLAKIVHGTKNMGQEMMNNLKFAEGAIMIKNRVQNNSKIVSKKKEAFIFKSLGKKVIYEYNTDLLCSIDLDPKNVNFYSRVKINNDIFTSSFYKTTKTNNYTIHCILKDSSIFYGIIQIFFISLNQLYFIVKRFLIDHPNILKHNEIEAVVSHIIPITDSDNFILVKIDQVKYLSHLVRVGNYICKQPNLLKSVT